MPTPYLRWIGSDNRQEVYLLNANEIVIGRSSGVDLMLIGHSVSRRHARILRLEEGFAIDDLGSSHGTYVNGKKIGKHTLCPGDRIRLGPDGIELFYSLDNAETTRVSDMWQGDQFEKSLQTLASIVPSRDSGYTDLEKMSCILDFHYNLGKSFSAESTFQQILKSALDISGAERGLFLLKKPGGMQYEVGLNANGAILPQSEFRTSQSVVRRVAEQGQPVFMTEGIGGDFAQQESIVAMNLRAVACLPLEAIPFDSDTPEVLGILYLDSTRKMHSLSGLDEKILSKLADQAGTVLEKLEMIRGLEERKKLEQELALAQETQRSLLPRSLPQLANFRIHAFNKPTRYVGGDFYDILQLGSAGWVGVLADVSGKGISAALLSSLVQGALNTEFRSGTQPAEVMQRLNKFVCEKTQAHRFVTIFLFLMNDEGTGEFISAGHNPAFLFRAATAQIEELAAGGLILGAFDFACYDSTPLQLSNGDVLLVYSDGLTEAENRQGEMFGEERVREILRKEGRAGSEVLERKLLEAIEDFTQGRSQTDDITFLLINRSV